MTLVSYSLWSISMCSKSIPGVSAMYVSRSRKTGRLSIDWAELPGSTNSRSMTAPSSVARLPVYSRWVAMELPSASMSTATTRYRMKLRNPSPFQRRTRRSILRSGVSSLSQFSTRDLGCDIDSNGITLFDWRE